MKRRVILCGAGHTHLYVASRAREYADRNTELLVIDPGTFWYSGMATGLLGGRYHPAEDCVDVARLVDAAGGRHLPDRISQIHPGEHTVHTEGGRTYRYDLVSLNIGSSVAPVPPGENQPDVWPVKPISNLHALHRKLVATMQAGIRPRCVVIGGGSTGSEAAGNLVALFRRHGLAPDVHLLTADARLCPHLPGGASLRIADRLQQRGVSCRFGVRVSAIGDHNVRSTSGETFDFDQLVLATGLTANRIVWDSDDTRFGSRSGGIEVDASLRSTHYADVYASGDCADLRGYQLPKIGVYGVRQAPVLHHNLLATLDGSPLRRFTPQAQYLSILNLGESEALATRGRLWWFGRSSMWLKEWLDRRFVAAYQKLAENTD